MKIGIIGVGVIGSAVAAGFCESHAPGLQVVLSPRGKERAETLQKKYPQQVQVAYSNQAVVDAADWIILSVLPAQAEAVLKELSFRPEQKLINLVSTLGMEQAQCLTGKLDVMVDVVPLPFNARRIGPVVLYPRVPEAEELISLIGDVVPVEDSRQMAILRTVTALMSPFYELTASVVDWCQESGLDEEAARKYTASFFGALSVIAGGYGDGLHELANEMTPGGLNWQALNALKDQNAFQPWKDALDPILERVTKK